ncbi:hypothetical protein O3M35_006818 [Rhynocoris fuscipes]|uniref:TFIID subunit TAF5 NTD2 domain-containing protein n=1 Tax=Rhynocoris fuscipes TaxID=488301 RepID=A0AAW1DIJ6_9HEMI
MDLDKIQEISEKAVSYFRNRRYIVGDVYLNRDTQVSRSEARLLDAVDFSASDLNPITSLASVAYDLSQAEQQFNALKTWITETLEDKAQTELTPALMPILCHIYLDCLRILPKQDCINFFMQSSVNLITEEWYPYVEQLLNIPSANDFSSHPLVKAFRESKFKLKLINETLVILRKFLISKDLYIIIAILQRWFEFEDDEEEEESDEDNSESNRNEEEGADSSEDESPLRTVPPQYAKQLEELMKEITAKRLQSTPPPPLLLYTAFRTEGIVCGRLSESHCLAATGDKRSEVRIWGIGENRMNPKFHDSYFQSVPLGEIDSDTDSECSGEAFDLTSDELQDLAESQFSSCAPSTSRAQEDTTQVIVDKPVIEEKCGKEESNDSGSEESSDAEREFIFASLGSSSKTSPTANPKIDIEEQRQTISPPSGYTNDQESVYNVETGDTIGFNSVQQMWPLHGHSDAVYDVAFVPNNDYLLSVSFDTTMRLWNLSDFSCPVVYRGHSSPVWSVAVSSLANYVATASSDKTAKLWCLDRTYPVRVMAGHLQAVTCVAFHPNGTYMATGSPDRTVRLWSITDGSMVRCMGGITDMGSVETLAFSPNGQYVASAGEDQCVWIWDLASGNYILKLTGHTCRIVAIDWSNDGSTVSAASLDGTILLWAIDNKEACSGNVQPKKYETGCAYLLSLEYSRNNGLLAFGLKEKVS